jgi:hypothetical protein
MEVSTESKTPIATQTSIQSQRLKSGTGGSMATIGDDDERLLAEIGYEQVRLLLQVKLDLVV